MPALVITLLMVTLCHLAFAASPAINIQPGKYEILNSMEMTMNANSKTYPSRTATRCLTPAQLTDPEQVFNERFGANYRPDTSCTQHNLKTSSTSVSYDEDCNNRTVHVDAALLSTSYSAVRKVLPKDPRAPRMTYKISAKRIGECTK